MTDIWYSIRTKEKGKTHKRIIGGMCLKRQWKATYLSPIKRFWSQSTEVTTEDKNLWKKVQEIEVYL